MTLPILRLYSHLDNIIDFCESPALSSAIFLGMANLVPEVRVDKNGRSVVRHVRADAGSKSRKLLPSPRVSKSAVNLTSVLDVLHLMSKHGVGKPGVKTTKQLLEDSAPHQIAILTDALSTLDTASPRQRQVIERGFSFGMAVTGRDTFYEKIALRSALEGDWKRESTPPLVDTNSCVYAARFALNGDVESPLDLEDDEVRKKSEAYVRFVFEARYHFSRTEYPLLYQATVNGKQVEKFVMPEFNDLVLDHSDRVHELLALIEDRKTTNAHLLRELMEREGPSAVSSGYL